MEISKQIKKYRLESKLSQEDLADKVFVTRQTISNWENNRNYPDINSLVLLSDLFDVSLDILVKGDLEKMKEQIEKEQVKTEDAAKMQHDGAILCILMIAVAVSVIPLFLYGGFIGVVIWGVLVFFMMYYAIRIEKQKKTHDIQTYKEILAFTEGKCLAENEKNQEVGKRPYQKIISVIVSMLVTAAICGVVYLVLFLLMGMKG